MVKKESAWQCRGNRFNLWSGKTPHAAEPPSLWATTTQACEPGACASQQKKPPQWERKSSHCTEDSEHSKINKCCVFFFLSPMLFVSESLRIIEENVVENWRKGDPYSVVGKFGKIIAWDDSVGLHNGEGMHKEEWLLSRSHAGRCWPYLCKKLWAGQKLRRRRHLWATGRKCHVVIFLFTTEKATRLGENLFIWLINIVWAETRMKISVPLQFKRSSSTM